MARGLALGVRGTHTHHGSGADMCIDASSLICTDAVLRMGVRAPRGSRRGSRRRRSALHLSPRGTLPPPPVIVVLEVGFFPPFPEGGGMRRCFLLPFNGSSPLPPPSITINRWAHWNSNELRYELTNYDTVFCAHVPNSDTHGIIFT